MPGAGWQVGEYVVDGPTPFAHGTFGTLYAGRRASDGCRAAIKFVWLTNAEDAKERLAAERHGAMLQQRFEQAHGMVPRVFEYGPYEQHLYIAMEFVEGQPLSALIRQGISPERAAKLAGRICDFLDRAHQFATDVEGVSYDRIVHADLKPDHVLLAHDGEMKVLDFGIAKALEKTTEVTTNNWSTVAYASPERLQSGGQVNVYADFWSLGVMLYEMVCGHLPYPALSPRHLRSELERAIRTNARPEPLPASCPPGLAAVIHKLMAHQPERRYATASSIRGDLDRFLAGASPLALPSFETPETVPVQRAPASLVAVPRAASRDIPATEPFPVPVVERAAAPPLSPGPAPRRRAGVLRRLLVLPVRLAVWPILLPFRALKPLLRLLVRLAARLRAAAAALAYVADGADSPLRRAAQLAVLLAGVGLVTTEGSAWMAAERFREELPAMEGRTLAEKRREYEGIEGWSLLDAGLRARVDAALRRQLVRIADRVIADYRRADPAMSAADWRQARDAVQWARDLDAGDPALLARQLTCEAHLVRLAARAHRRGSAPARQAYRTAISRFEEAARADDRSFDPYLGISNIHAYGLEDVDLAAEAIEKAEERGYEPGRRERALLGDGYLRRGDRARRRAGALEDDARRAELESARDDYERCVERFEPIRDFGRAAANLSYCRTQAGRVARELDEVDAVRWVM